MDEHQQVVNKHEPLWRGLRFRTAGFLLRLGEWLELHPEACLLLIAGCYLPVALLEAHARPLLNDEIYTLHIAQAPGLRSILRLAREIDLHPPLHYLSERLALRSGLPRLIAARLPSLLAGLVACFALFGFARRRLGNVFATVAVEVLWTTPALAFAWSNRPYMQWLAWLCLLLWAYDLAMQEPRKPWCLALVFALTVAMVGTDLLGIACILPFAAAEGVRWRQRGRLDGWLLLCLVSPAVIGLGFFYQMHHLSENVFPDSTTASFGVAAEAYLVTYRDTVPMVAGCAFAVVAIFYGVWSMGSRGLEAAATVKKQNLSTRDMTLLLVLLVVPVLLLVAGAVLHLQFWPRYCAASLPAAAVLFAAVLARRLPYAALLGVVMVAAGVGYMVNWAATDIEPMSNAGQVIGGRRPIPLETLDPTLPIVAASPMTFVEMSDRGPSAIAQRTYYLTDREAALRYAHYTLFENEDKIRTLLDLPSKTQDLTGFLATHQTFYVVGDYSRPEIWLLRTLAERGLRLEYEGKFVSSYESDDLWLVRRPEPTN